MSAVHDVWKRGLKLGPIDYTNPYFPQIFGKISCVLYTKLYGRKKTMKL